MRFWAFIEAFSGCSRAEKGFGFVVSNPCHHQGRNFNENRSDSLMGFRLQSEERIRVMVEREIEHLPRGDYLMRLQSGDLDLSFRKEALDWILKAHAHFNFGPLSVCLSMNYLDRFLSVYELPRGRSWTVQLLAVACLSLAAKIDETEVPLSLDLQVGEPEFVFDAKTIQRMELLVLSTLKWRLQACTPCSFIDYFLGEFNDDHHPSPSSISRSVRLILSTISGIDFLEFKPSEIAAAVTISVSGNVTDTSSSYFTYVDKGKVLKCIQLIKDLLLLSNASTPSLPQSPNGVLDAACLSYQT